MTKRYKRLVGLIGAVMVYFTEVVTIQGDMLKAGDMTTDHMDGPYGEGYPQRKYSFREARIVTDSSARKTRKLKWCCCMPTLLLVIIIVALLT